MSPKIREVPKWFIDLIYLGVNLSFGLFALTLIFSKWVVLGLFLLFIGWPLLATNLRKFLPKAY